MDLSEYSVLFLIISLWNLVVFGMYGLDKFLAKNQMWRISEKVLLSSAFALGGVGAFSGMKFFRHKTKHDKFKVTLPIAAVLTIGALFLVGK